MTSNYQDFVLFLGAGFSYDADLPLMTKAGDPNRNDNEDLPIFGESMYAKGQS